jgi:rRNA maturation endonuclease Nob1
MQNDNLKSKEKSPCSLKNAALPDFITCPKCGDEIEIWTDEDETACASCGHKVFKKESTVH